MSSTPRVVVIGNIETMSTRQLLTLQLELIKILGQVVDMARNKLCTEQAITEKGKPNTWWLFLSLKKRSMLIFCIKRILIFTQSLKVSSSWWIHWVDRRWQLRWACSKPRFSSSWWIHWVDRSCQLRWACCKPRFSSSWWIHWVDRSWQLRWACFEHANGHSSSWCNQWFNRSWQLH